MQCNSITIKKPPEAYEWQQTHIFENAFLQMILIISIIPKLYAQPPTMRLFYAL